MGFIAENAINALADEPCAEVLGAEEDGGAVFDFDGFDSRRVQIAYDFFGEGAVDDIGGFYA